MKHIVVLRFSAIGDVVLVLPVIKNILTLNTNLKITIITRPNFAFFFKNIERLYVLEADMDKEFKGIVGLYRLSKKIKSIGKIDAVVDLHDVLRTKILRTILKLSSIKIIVFNKGRNEKKEFIQQKLSTPLLHTTQRYANAFEKLDLQISNQFELPAIKINEETKKIAHTFFEKNKSNYQIGIAPFAKHTGKIFPTHKMEELLQQLEHKNNAIFLFGGGSEEEKQMKIWAEKYTHIHLTTTLNFEAQVALMQHLHVMLAMDSGNMHIATLQNIPVVSIWGATYAGIGFSPINNEQNIIEINRALLPCRPCSVFGNKPCHLKETPYKCMEDISVQSVFNRVLNPIR